MSDVKRFEDIPLLPLRDIIVFPNMVLPLFVGRPKSRAALEAAMSNENKEIILSAQKKAKTKDPAADEIYEVGTIAVISQLFQFSDGTVKVVVRGTNRVKITKFNEESDAFFSVDAESIPDILEPEVDFEALSATVRQTFQTYVELNKRIPREMLTLATQATDPSRLSDLIVAQLAINKLQNKQEILEISDVGQRMELLQKIMKEEIEILQVEKKIRSRVKKQMENSDKGDAQARDLGDPNEFKNEIEELEERIEKKDLPDHAQDRVKRELKKLKMMSPMSAEATVVRNYVEWILSLPWNETTEDRLDIDEAKATLEADHYGLEKPKERILEYLSVQKLVEKQKGSILCFVGPPGVGKTSLGKSIASATNRNFVRLSLGGVRDEAEIRGHRRTYIGALPGKIIQSLKKAGSSNPVFLLDEIDKMSTDFRGDPSSAMLEVLDPEQNESFGDHYLDLDYDLSNVMFICTANDLSKIPGPLRDRMEIIEIGGYLDHEKLAIAQTYLVPKQITNNGIANKEVNFSPEAINRVVEEYTREAGVRNLERELGSICRKIARKVVEGTTENVFDITAENVPEYLGPKKMSRTLIEEKNQIGLTNGLAWTQYGGVMLVNEATIMPGRGKLIITGKLGDVMQESAQAAMSYIRTRAENFGLNPQFHNRIDIHIHFPEGAVPKDGPSAGITMVTTLVSALTNIPVRRDVAMTGEITLRGRVLPIGGLKEKTLAAKRAGIKTILFPAENQKDLSQIPEEILIGLEMIPVSHADEVLMHALELKDPESFRKQLSQPITPPDLISERPPRSEAVH